MRKSHPKRADLFSLYDSTSLASQAGIAHIAHVHLQIYRFIFVTKKIA